MTKVTSARFQKEFGHFSAKALREPVIITDHGREDLALISAEHYRQLCEHNQRAFYVHELPQEVVDEFGTVPVPEETRKFDHEYQGE